MIISTTLVRFLVIFTLLFCSATEATLITHTSFGSIEDVEGDGTGDQVDSFVPGSFLNVPGVRIIRAFLEYDLSSFDVVDNVQASFSGTVGANNFADTGTRIFNISFFAGNGVLDVADFNVDTEFVGQLSYDPQINANVAFDFDVSSIVRSLIENGQQFVGFRFEGVNFQSASAVIPQLVNFEVSPSPVPAPNMFFIFLAGVALLIFNNKNCITGFRKFN